MTKETLKTLDKVLKSIVTAVPLPSLIFGMLYFKMEWWALIGFFVLGLLPYLLYNNLFTVWLARNLEVADNAD